MAPSTTTKAARSRSDVGPGPYRINVAARLSGVPAATLRAWERRYGIPAPRRTTAAYRLYSAADVDLVRRMRELVDDGVASAEAARRLLASSATDVLSTEEERSAGGLEPARERLLAATHRWDVSAIDSELTRLSMLVDAQNMYDRVVSPVLFEVGTRWAAGELSIAQEHMLSERLEVVLRACLRVLERSEGPIVALACVDAEQHVLGMLGAALRFAASGARVVALGAMTPASAVADAVRHLSPRLVGLSVALPPAKPRALFQAYARACGTTPWVVGGAAAESVRGAVSAAGGLVASGSATSWSTQVRDWLRGPR